MWQTDREFIICSILLLLTIFFTINAEDSKLKCGYADQSTSDIRNFKKSEVYKKLVSLQDERFQYKLDDITYYFAICTIPTASMFNNTKIGAAYAKTNSDPVAIGMFDKTVISAGTNWIMVEYKLKTDCSSTLMITCSPTSGASLQMKLLEGEPGKDCNYLFELERADVCISQPMVSFSLSTGSIIVIIFVCVVFVYLLSGVVYKRVIHGAKGFEQIPNFEMWKDFGNLQADGCNLVCRNSKPSNNREYKGVADDQLDDSDHDDHLLPM